jgi:hypothetical protein
MVAITLSGNSVNFADAVPFSITCGTAYPQIQGTSNVAVYSNDTDVQLYSFNWNLVTIAGVNPESQADAVAKITALLQNNFS